MEQNSSILERKGEGEGHAERKAIVATFWESESDAEGLHHYAGPLDLREGGMADAEGAEYVEMWMLLCRRINLLEHDRRVVSLLDAWSFMPYFVATSDDPEVAHWLALLDALQNKLPLRACQTCGDLFQPAQLKPRLIAACALARLAQVDASPARRASRLLLAPAAFQERALIAGAARAPD